MIGNKCCQSTTWPAPPEIQGTTGVLDVSSSGVRGGSAAAVVNRSFSDELKRKPSLLLEPCVDGGTFREFVSSIAEQQRECGTEQRGCGC